VHLRDIRPVPAASAETQNNLGKAYAELTTGDRTANLHKAIDLYEAALRVSTEKDSPAAWVETHATSAKRMPSFQMGIAWRI